VGGLYLVEPSLKERFERYRGFVAGGMRTLSPGEKASSAFILTEADRATSLSVTAYFAAEELALANIVGTIPGRRDDEIVVFSAHYDHIGITTPVEGDSIANGANDNASGTTAVIELARHFKQMGTPERTLMFVAFTAEEMGGYGSQYFSKQLEPDQIVAMFNIEMIGKPAASGPNSAWITGFDRSDFGWILREAVEGTEYRFYADPYPNQNLFYRSDNATLARLGVPAHSISTTPIDVDRDYHQVSDEVKTLDLDHLAITIGAIAVGAQTIVSGEATPTRVDPDTVE
jgi:Zn-dependent M28 family amino/carboxypeptidase